MAWAAGPAARGKATGEPAGAARSGACAEAATIRAAGGRVIAEDESTCTVWGMPKAVAERGVADAIVPLHEVTRTIAKLSAPAVRRAS